MHPGANVVEEFLRSLRMGRPQVSDNLVLFPLRSWLAGSQTCLSLAEATDAGLLQVTEIGTTGSLPDLEIRNAATLPVLLLSGEELGTKGRKRTLTTAVLLEEASETTIPASCIKQEHSNDSADPILELLRQKAIKKPKDRRIPPSPFMRVRPDRSTIVSKIDLLRDVLIPRQIPEDATDPAELWNQTLSRALRTFRRASAQKGALFLVNAEPIGFEIVSEEGCFARHHTRLVKKYISMGVLDDNEEPADADKAEAIARRFLDEAIGCRGESREPIACGRDYLFRGPSMTGSALVYQDRVIHVAFHRHGAGSAGPRLTAPNTARRNYVGGPNGLVGRRQRNAG